MPVRDHGYRHSMRRDRARRRAGKRRKDVRSAGRSHGRYGGSRGRSRRDAVAAPSARREVTTEGVVGGAAIRRWGGPVRAV